MADKAQRLSVLECRSPDCPVLTFLPARPPSVRPRHDCPDCLQPGRLLVRRGKEERSA